jgi:putative lipoic acid-binding regulatory protein
MEESKWQTLKEKLETQSWPRIYMFKFIVPADNKRIAQVENLFNTREAEVTMRTSSKGNFVSITAKELMLSADAVIERYRSAEGIEGLISL